MKTLAAIALLLVSAAAAAGVTVTDVPGTHDLYKGSKKIGSYPAHADCVAAAKALFVTAGYTCRTSSNVNVTVVVDPKPADQTQVMACPLGSVPGAMWTQVRTFVSAPAPTFWVPGPWLPPTPLPGACPVQPPMTMHGGLAVDESTIPAPQAGVADDRIAAWQQVPARSAEYPAGQFRTVCYFSHYGFDDPIVHPGEKGASHLHVFNGNGSTDAFSTLATLRQGTSTCRGGVINQTAYWQPAMFDAVTKRVIPESISILYYKASYGLDPTQIHAMPEGMKMVAGDPSAKAPLQYGPTRFSCDGNAVGNDNTFPYVPDPRGPHTIPAMADCGVGHTVHAEVNFPDCWDGVNLDSPDHRSHVVYNWSPVNGLYQTSCPADHPVQIPTITIKMVYPINAGDNTANWRLVSDTYDPALPGGYSLHADWFNGWRPEIMDVWIKNCLQAGNDCQAHMLGDGRVMDGFNGN